MQHLGTISRPRVILAATLTIALAVGGLLPWRVVAQSCPPLSTPPVATQGDETWQKQQQKELADIASKNAQLDAQLVEVRKHLPAAQAKTALSFIGWINADYATNQMKIQLLEQQRADYVAVHPNSLTNNQIAFVQKAILDKLNHKHIGEKAQAKLASIPANQQDRVAALRYYDFNITAERMRALVEKQASVVQLRAEYAASKQRRHAAVKPQRARIFQIAFRVSRQGTHRVRVLTQDATGQHLIVDKLCQAGESLTIPTTAHGNRVGFCIYDNGKLVKNQSL